MEKFNTVIKTKIRQIIANSINLNYQGTKGYKNLTAKDIPCDAILSEDLPIDSLTFIEIILSLEEIFLIDISFAQSQKIHNFNDLVATVEGRC